MDTFVSFKSQIRIKHYSSIQSLDPNVQCNLLLFVVTSYWEPLKALYIPLLIGLPQKPHHPQTCHYRKGPSHSPLLPRQLAGTSIPRTWIALVEGLPSHILYTIHQNPESVYLSILTLMLLVANLANSKWCKKKIEKWLKPWQMGTHLRVLGESSPMNTNMTGLRLFSKIFASL